MIKYDKISKQCQLDSMPGTSSGKRMIVHTGHEFVYTLSGQILHTTPDRARGA